MAKRTSKALAGSKFWKVFLSQALALVLAGCGSSGDTGILGNANYIPPTSPPSGDHSPAPAPGNYQDKTFSYPNFLNGAGLSLVSTYQPDNVNSSLTSSVISTISGSMLGQLAQLMSLGSEPDSGNSQAMAACGTSYARELGELLRDSGVKSQSTIRASQTGGTFENLAEGALYQFYMITASKTVTAKKMLGPNDTIHCSIFAEVDEHGNPCIDRSKAVQVAAAFDSNNPNRPGSGIYDQVRAAFGSEWNQNPVGGRDGDMKVVIMFFRSQTLGEYLFGYTSPADGYREDSSLSNKGEIVYLNGDKPTAQNLSTLAHEFQHLINQNEKVSRQGTFPSAAQGENETINEGLSQISEDICGFDLDHGNQLLVLNINDYFSRSADYSFFKFKQGGLLGYGQGYLFFRYVREQFGDGVIRSIVTSPLVGKQNLDSQLASVGFNEVFRRWAVANYATNLGGSVPAIYRYPSGFRTNGSYGAGQLTGPKMSPFSGSGSPSTKSLLPWSASYQTLIGGASGAKKLDVRVPSDSTASVIYEAVKGTFTQLDQ